MGRAEKVLRVEDAAHDQEQIQHRLTVFQDSWPRLEKWFTKYGLLKSVDATQGADTVYLEVEKIMEDTLEKVCISFDLTQINGNTLKESIIFSISVFLNM